MGAREGDCEASQVLRPPGVTRPALADERIQTNAAGRVVLKLKTAWRDGITRLVISRLEIIQRQAGLVRRCQSSTVRSHLQRPTPMQSGSKFGVKRGL